MLAKDDITTTMAHDIMRAYDASPSVCDFEALAYGRWIAEGNRGGIGRAWDDTRFRELRREEGKRIAAGAGFDPGNSSGALIAYARSLTERPDEQ